MATSPLVSEPLLPIGKLPHPIDPNILARRPDQTGDIVVLIDPIHGLEDYTSGKQKMSIRAAFQTTRGVANSMGHLLKDFYPEYVELVGAPNYGNSIKLIGNDTDPQAIWAILQYYDTHQLNLPLESFRDWDNRWLNDPSVGSYNKKEVDEVLSTLFSDQMWGDLSVHNYDQIDPFKETDLQLRAILLAARVLAALIGQPMAQVLHSASIGDDMAAYIEVGQPMFAADFPEKVLDVLLSDLIETGTQKVAVKAPSSPGSRRLQTLPLQTAPGSPRPSIAPSSPRAASFAALAPSVISAPRTVTALGQM